MGLLPDRWLKYSAVGAQIEGTRFIAFKVPLDNLDVNSAKHNAEGDDLDVKEMINTKIMFERIPNLGLVIDLTNTRKYYNSKNVTDLGIEYKKIFVPGQRLPAPHIYQEFMGTVTDFLRRNAENDKLIGVHCTHGLNRTGLMICAHMIQKCNIDPSDAVARFETARGHKMERENYVESLRTMTANMELLEHDDPPFSDVISHGNQRTLSTQTNAGVWLEATKPKSKRKRHATDPIDDVRGVKGTVYVDGGNLISDGNGGYYMRVNLNEVRPMRGTMNAFPSNQLNFAPPEQNYNARQPYYSNHSLWRNSNANETFYSNQSRNSGSNRYDGRSGDHNARNFGQPFRSQKYSIDTSDPFKW